MNVIKFALGISFFLLSVSITRAGDNCCCPECGKVCYATPKVEKVKKHGYCVEKKHICIPKIRFSLSCFNKKPKCNKPTCGPKGCSPGCNNGASCTNRCASGTGCTHGAGGTNGCTGNVCAGTEVPRCGRVKEVKVLKKKEYECEHCGYEWKIYDVCNVGQCTESFAPAQLQIPVQYQPTPAMEHHLAPPSQHQPIPIEPTPASGATPPPPADVQLPAPAARLQHQTPRYRQTSYRRVR